MKHFCSILPAYFCGIIFAGVIQYNDLVTNKPHLFQHALKKTTGLISNQHCSDEYHNPGSLPHFDIVISG